MNTTFLILCMILFQEWPEYKVEQGFQTECKPNAECHDLVIEVRKKSQAMEKENPMEWYKRQLPNECYDCRATTLETRILKRTPEGNHKMVQSWSDEDISKESVEAYKKFAEEWIERDKAKARIR